MVWCKKIPKAQHAEGDDFGLGFRVLAYKGNNYVFFLDDIKNLNLQQDQTPSVYSDGWRGTMMAVKLDETGSMQKTVAFDAKELKEKMDILNSDRIGPNALINRVWNRKGSKVCLITIE